MSIDWSKVQSPMDRQKHSLDGFISDTARLLNEHPQVRWTRDFVENIRRQRNEPLQIHDDTKED